MTQQFAVASISPRSIAWLIKSNEWSRLEEIVQLNSALLGGYYNVFIPLTEHNALSVEYQRFLFEYDPDLIVLAPDALSAVPPRLREYHCPFAQVPWESVTSIASPDPWSENPDGNVALGQNIHAELKDAHFYVAVADPAKPDFSSFAFLTCGDVKPHEIHWDVGDKEYDLNARGHREFVLGKLLKPEYEQRHAGMHLPHWGTLEAVPPPDRQALKSLIREEHQFPLSDPVARLSICCQMQYEQQCSSFISLTTCYHKRTERLPHSQPFHAIAVLVSDHFDMEEAILFWNLRASQFYVVWLSFADLETCGEDIARWFDTRWLNGYYGGVFYAMTTGSFSFAFSAKDVDRPRLQDLLETLQPTMQEGLSLNIISRNDLIVYDCLRPSIKTEHVVVAQDGPHCTVIPPLPQEGRSGFCAMTLRWDELMLPPYPSIRDLVSFQVMESFHVLNYVGRRPSSIQQTFPMKKFRIEQNRCLRVQVNATELTAFTRPSVGSVVDSLFQSGGFIRVEMSSTARYHRNFVDRTGSLTQAAWYLAMSPYRELLELLANNSNSQKKGWLLKEPGQRRALHHLDILETLQKSIPAETRAYFNSVSDELPTEVMRLLQQQIMERGFQLTCQSCSFRSWYPAEHIGQTFTCPRCYHTQVCLSNPLWLYKLAEVVFQGFADNMQVPLLSLDYLRRLSSFHFDWLPDSNVYWHEKAKEVYKNVDILCLCDGRLYIGEAKSNGEIPSKQFAFYEDVSKRVAVDGLVFATSEPSWNAGTQARIKQLGTHFKGDVLVLTAKQLYSGAADGPG